MDSKETKPINPKGNQPWRSDAETQFNSVAQSCPTLCNSMNCSTPGCPIHYQLLKLTQTHIHGISDAIQPSHPLSSPSPPAFNLSQHQGLFSESVLHTRWPTYWSFSFSISPSNEHSGLISFRTDWLALLAVQGTLKSLLQHHSWKASILPCSAFFIVQLSHPYMTTGKTIALTRRTFVGKVMSLLFNMLSRLVIAFLLRSKYLLISWLQSPSAVILEPKNIKPLTVSIVSDSLWAHGLYSLWNSPSQNTGVGSLYLLQGIFPTQGSNPDLPHCRQILYQLTHKGRPVLKLKFQYLDHLMQKPHHGLLHSLGKTLMLGKTEDRRRMGKTEDEMVGWHHQLNGHEFWANSQR